MIDDTTEGEARTGDGLSVDWANAYIVVTTMMCGFAFAGFILYIGTTKLGALETVAASLLCGSFFCFLYAALVLTDYINVGEDRLSVAQEHYLGPLLCSITPGLLLLVASVCVMSFGHGLALGFTSTALAGLFGGAVVRAVARGTPES